MGELKQLSFDMDDRLGNLNNKIQNIDDVKTMLLELQDDLANSEFNQRAPEFYIHEVHRRVRIMSELLRYTMDEIIPEFKATCDIHEKLFEQVQQIREKDQSAGNTLAVV